MSPLRRAWESDLAFDFRRSPAALVAALVLLAFLVAALAPSLVAPVPVFDLTRINLRDAFTPPSWMEEGSPRFLLGTDGQGRDLLSAIVYGARVSMMVGLGSVLLALAIGVPLGLVAGYRGGRVEALIMRVADVQLTFPAILVAVILDGVARIVLGPALHAQNLVPLLVLAIGLTGWVQYARTVRAATMVERRRDYVAAAILVGRGATAVMLRHILPNVMTPILVLATIHLAVAIILEATLSFVGLGIPPTQPSLGTLVRLGNDYLMSGEWWIAIFPGLALLLLVLAVNILGDWLRDALNPMTAIGDLPMRATTFLGAILGAILGAALAATPAAAQTLRLGVNADAGSMDPQAQNIQTTLTLHSMVFDALVTRDRQMRLVPGLATRWELTSPTTWRFHLRPGVRFHGGESFGADDVRFTIERAKHASSQFGVFAATMNEVRIVDDLTVDIVSATPDPLIPDKLTYLFIMDRGWAEANNVREPQNLRTRQETHAALNANGTGPFVLRRRDPDAITLLERNPGYWGTMEGNVQRVEWRPIGSDPTRISALLSRELDLVVDVPTQDVARLQRDAALKVERTEEFRTIFFGFDLQNDQLRYGQPGANPFRDRRVREAFYRAIDIEAVSRAVMRGLATPTGQLLAPGNVGYDAALDRRLPFDPEGARRLLREAGVPQNYNFTLDCPNDRYVNDDQVCQAITAMLNQVGFNVTLNLMPRARYFPKLWDRDTSAFMMGFNSPYFDGMYALETLHMTRRDPEGVFNYSLFSNPEIDALVRAARDETDLVKRATMMQAAWRRVTEELIYIPMYHQILVWAMRRNVEAPLRPDNWLEIRWVRVT